jgi:hypothetical protein
VRSIDEELRTALVSHIMELKLECGASLGA